jgi:hypothetical protein
MSFQLLELTRYRRLCHSHYPLRFTEGLLLHHTSKRLHGLKPIHIRYLTKYSINRAE